MVRLTFMLARTPVIKFRKGGLGPRPAAPAAASSPTAAAAPAAAPGSAPISSSQPSEKEKNTRALGVIKVPRGVLLDCGKKKKEIVSLNITLNIKSK